jgi:hypothetical protein
MCEICLPIGSSLAKYLALSMVILVLTFLPDQLHAQAKGSWTKLDAQPADVRIIVHLRKGNPLTCTLRGTTDDEILVVVPSGNELRIPKSNITEITAAQTHNDSLKNGSMWGVSFGIGFGILNGKAQGTGAAVGAFGLYMVGGILIDRLHKSHEVLYKAR